jgi:hypothetical protein
MLEIMKMVKHLRRSQEKDEEDRRIREGVDGKEKKTGEGKDKGEEDRMQA